MNNKFSENLKKIRKDNNLSQEQLAEEIGVSRQAISKWESATAYPEMDKIIALCDKFNLNIDDLLHKNIREIKGEEETKRNLNKYVDDFFNFITNTINLFSNMNFKSKIKCLFEQAIIILALLVASLIIGSIGKYFISSLFGFMPNRVYYVIYSIIESIYIIFCFVVSLIILVHIFKTRYLDYYDKLKKDTNTLEDTNDIVEEIEKSKIDKTNKILFKKNENKIIIRDPKHSEYKFINGLFKFILGIVKFFALCISIILFIILVCLFCAFIVSFLVYKTGPFFVGLLGILLSSAVIDIVLILVVLNFVFNRKNDKKKLIWSLIMSLISFGMSCGLVFIGTLSFEYVGTNEEMLKTDYIEFDMRNGLFFESYENIDYVSANISNIKIEYTINKYCDIEASNNMGNGVYLWSYCSNPIKQVKEIITNINDKKIIDLTNQQIETITIYASEENINLLKQNENSYNEKIRKDEINSYENEIGRLESEIDDYVTKVWEYEQEINNLKEKVNLYENME